ncbi:MAG: hypothetical protein Q8O42_01870 [Acidobacteriota bacterium]|nr:hypothetical protein [Acidobacteriota bacterium]
MLAAGLIAVFALAAGLRWVPVVLAPQGAGVDHWFWKSYVEALRRDRVFPPELPQYILDEKQWYPPLFGLFLARLPESTLDRWSPHVAIAIDLARMALLVSVAAWQSDGDPAVLLVAALVYATTPIQISYNIQLNPRGLAAIMLDGLLVALLWGMTRPGPWWVWGVVVILGGLILVTHKMTTQLMVFVIAGTAAIYGRPELLLLLPAWFVAAMVMSRGFYWKILVAHMEIVQFWHRNWRWIGADLLRESPIYGDGKYERAEKLHKSGLKGLAWHGFIMFGFNPAAWIACLLVYERAFSESQVLIYPTPLLVWLLLPCLWAILTSVVDPFKRFGAGYLYVYNTSLVSSLVIALTYRYTHVPELSLALLLAAIGLNLAGVAIYYRHFLGNKRTRVDEGLDQMLDRLRTLPRGVVMCLPVNWCEVVAYKTGQPVLWGGHGLGFDNLQPTWPRLLIPIKDVVATYSVRYFLTMEGTLPDKFIADLPPATVTVHHEYRLYCFEHLTEVAHNPARSGGE